MKSVVIAIALCAQTASALTIDGFTAAVNTKLPPGLVKSSVGSISATDTGLSNVLGGKRTLTLEATALTFPRSDYVQTGVNTTSNVLSFSATSTATGTTEVVYDNIGVLDLSSYTYINVPMTAVDADTPFYTVTLKLFDGTNTSTDVKGFSSAGPITIHYVLSSYIYAVNLAHITKITLKVVSHQAADFSIGAINTTP